MDIEIGSLSKAFSVMGGFIAAKQPLVDAYLMSARQRLFSIALTIPVRAAQSCSFHVISSASLICHSPPGVG